MPPTVILPPFKQPGPPVHTDQTKQRQGNLSSSPHPVLHCWTILWHFASFDSPFFSFLIRRLSSPNKACFVPLVFSLLPEKVIEKDRAAQPSHNRLPPGMAILMSCLHLTAMKPQPYKLHLLDRSRPPNLRVLCGTPSAHLLCGVFILTWPLSHYCLLVCFFYRKSHSLFPVTPFFDTSSI